MASGSPCSRASSCCSATTFCCRVRIISRPVRSPTWASRGYSWPPKLRWLILPSPSRPMALMGYCTFCLEEPPIGDRAGGDQPDVEVGEQHPAQRDPGELHVLGVQLGHLGPHPVPHRVLGEMPEPPADRVPAGVAGQAVAPPQGRV